MKNLIVVTTTLVLGSGCTITKFRHFEDIPQQGVESSYKYYVIDINSDMPDAFFETFEEASVYRKEFAENHEYVIVKLEKGYKVYNMVDLPKEKDNDTQTVQTSK